MLSESVERAPLTAVAKVLRTDAEVVVVTCNSASYIEGCLRSIPCDVFPTIVVDNASSDATLDIVRRTFPQVTIVENGKNLGYGPACNIGFHGTRAEYVVFSNADVVYSEGAVETLIDFLKAEPRVGITAPQFVYPDGRWQLSYADTPGVWTGIKDVMGLNTLHRSIRRLLWPRRLDRNPRDVPYVAGAVLALPRRAFAQMNGFDEDFYFYADESDLCMRLRKSHWRVVFCPLTQVVHVGGGDSVRVDFSERFLRHMVNSMGKLARKHLSPWRADFYMRTQWLFFGAGAAICRCAAFVRPGRSRLEARQKLFNAYARMLREYAEDRTVNG